MAKMQQKLLLSVVFCLVAYGSANPAVEREFNKVVNSNQCLRLCMTPVRESDTELSIFKRGNLSDYLLNLDKICGLVTDARRCIDACEVTSNPFALISVNVICSKKARDDAKTLEPCLTASGTQVHAECVQTCGDYDALNDNLHLSTSTLKPEDQNGLQSVNEQTNFACSVMKCSARCSVDKFNQQCGRLENGQLAGELLREIIEGVLTAHRTDLEVFGLLKAMQKNTQPQCNYLHTSDVLFNPLKDIVSQQIIRQNQQMAFTEQTPEAPKQTEIQQQQPTSEQQQERMMASRLYVKILRKQLQVLNKQLELMDKQEQKMELPQTNEMF